MFATVFILSLLCSSALAAVGVHATYWAKSSGTGGCQLPTADYAVTNALALGQETVLGNLAFDPSLCGQVFNVNCGHNSIKVVVASACNLGSTSCGVDLIEKTWNLATNNASPGIIKCNVTLSTTNPLKASGPQCFHQPGYTGSVYTVKLGLLSTSSKRTDKATIRGISGTRGSSDGWFEFNANGQPLFTNEQVVTFEYRDKSTVQFKIGDCKAGGQTHVFQ